jgi:hypothetical protein
MVSETHRPGSAARITDHVGRVGINYKFDGPISAAY